MALIIGVDDAGRGPVIGPMVLAGVLIKDIHEGIFRNIGVKDSKALTAQKRTEIAEIIRKNSVSHKVILVSPLEIDSSIDSGVNLNTLEAIKIADVINCLNSVELANENITVVVDCPSPNIIAWKNTLINYIKNPSNLDIKCEHKADANHLSVSAASILAKVERDLEVSKIREKFGEVGSGYASDPITKKFVEQNWEIHKDSGLFRKSWQTWKDHQIMREQKNLGDF